MWVHQVGNWECRCRLRHPKRFFTQESFVIGLQDQDHISKDLRTYAFFFFELSPKLKTFASKFIRVRAFHKAISRSCVLFNTSRQKWKIIPLLAHGDRPTGLPQGLPRQARREEKKRKEMERAKKKKDVGSSNVIESTAAGCSIPNNQVFLWRCLPPWLAHSKSTGTVKRMGRLEWASISFKLKSFLNFCVEIYTHPRISQSDFPVMCFVSLKSTKEKNKFAFAIGIQSGLE